MMNIDINKIRKKYNWNKKWVRQYESVFGIFLNFCRVNVLEGSEALKIFNISTIRYTKNYIPEFIMYCTSRSKENYNNVLEKLTPKWYLEQIHIFQTMDVYTLNKCLNIEDLVYCPECMKSGYHSILHQIKGAEYCPFHSQKLVMTTNKKYWSDYLITSITWEKEQKEDNMPTIKRVVLPCCRKEMDVLLDFKLKTNTRFWYVSTDNEPGIDTYAHNTLDFLLRQNSSRRILVERERISFEMFREEFAEWINWLRLPCDILKRLPVYKIHRNEIGSNCLPFFMYTKYLSLFSSSERLLITSEKMYEIVKMKKISINQLLELKIFFIWLIKDSPGIFSPFSIRWLIHPFGCDNDQQHYVGNRALAIDNIERVSERHIIGDSYVDENILLFHIVSDLIDELWKQVYTLAKETGGFDTENGWKKLKVPEYFITYSGREDVYEIYRYE